MRTEIDREQVVAEMARRLVEYYRPLRIYLFGSEARGDAGPDIDLDFLVVLPDDTPDEKMRGSEALTLLAGLGVPKDVVPWRQSDFDARAAWVRASLPATVIREGRLLYESAALLTWQRSVLSPEQAAFRTIRLRDPGAPDRPYSEDAGSAQRAAMR